MIKVSPSILSADFVNLERDIRALTPAGADYVHIDVMDGEFVPNITIGIPVVAAIRKITELPLDVHLMIDRPIRYVDDFCKAGADILTIHLEADTPENTRRALENIRANGVKAALSIKPKTPAEAVVPYLPLCSLILVMTVEPGFGGQSFMQVFSAFRQQNLRRWYFPILIFRRKPCMHLPVLTRKRKAIRGAPSKRMTWSATTIQLLNRTSRRFWRMQTGQKRSWRPAFQPTFPQTAFSATS